MSDIAVQLPLFATIAVPGSGSRSYDITHKQSDKGDYYHCTCPSWKFISRPIEERQCKHIIALLGGSTSGVVTPNHKKSVVLRAEQRTTVTGKRKNEASLLEVALAEKWTSEDPTGFFMSEKLDGMRCIWDGSTLRTRTGNTINAPSKLVAQLPDTSLDGELFLGRGKFQELMGIVRRQTPNEHDWDRVTFMVFDAPLVSAPFQGRLSVAATSLVGCAWAQLHPHKRCKGRDHVMTELERILQEGGEGVMLRNPHAQYKGGRTTDLLKVKTFHDAEAFVTGFENGTGRNNGRVGALICVDTNGITFKIGTGLKDYMRDKPPSIGTRITYKYQEKTLDGKPRFPVFVRERPTE